MRRVRFVLLTATLIALTPACTAADEKPAAADPAQILAECVRAAEEGDFERYVDYLSPDEQKLQVGYIVFLTSTTSLSFDSGAQISDPEVFLLARTMRDLVKQHSLTESERKAANADAKTSSSTTVPGYYNGQAAAPYVAGPYQSPHTPRSQFLSYAGTLRDVRAFLIAALDEVARPTVVSGEPIDKADATFNYRDIITRAKDVKWAIYERGDYAVAITAKPTDKKQNKWLSATRDAANSQTHVEFQRIDGEWKITRLLPTTLMGSLTNLAGLTPNVTSRLTSSYMTPVIDQPVGVTIPAPLQLLRR